MRTYHIASWNLENLENLFVEEDAVALGRRTHKVFRAIKNDIAGWTPQLRDRKIDQLAKSQMARPRQALRSPTRAARTLIWTAHRHDGMR